MMTVLLHNKRLTANCDRCFDQRLRIEPLSAESIEGHVIHRWIWIGIGRIESARNDQKIVVAISRNALTDKGVRQSISSHTQTKRPLT